MTNVAVLLGGRSAEREISLVSGHGCAGALREEGFPIGSGMVESACKQFRARLAGSGMRWSRAGLERLLPIRAAIMSQRFDELWQKVYHLPRN